MKYLIKFQKIGETISLLSMGFSLVLFIIAIVFNFNPILVALTLFESGFIFGVATLIYFYSRINNNENDQIQEAHIELDKIASGKNQLSDFEKLKTQKVVILDKRTDGKRKVETIGERGETF